MRESEGVTNLYPGVLMMGYELYRQLANRKPRRKRSKLEPRQEERENKAERKILSGKQPV